MIFKTALRSLSAAALIATAVSIALISGAIAVGALLCQYVGLPAAAALTALLAAVVAAVAGLLLKPRTVEKLADAPNHDDLLGRAIDLGRKRPMLAVAATVAVGVFALRNPKLIGALVSALIAKEAVTPTRR